MFVFFKFTESHKNKQSHTIFVSIASNSFFKITHKKDLLQNSHNHTLKTKHKTQKQKRSSYRQISPQKILKTQKNKIIKQIKSPLLIIIIQTFWMYKSRETRKITTETSFFKNIKLVSTGFCSNTE